MFMESGKKTELTQTFFWLALVFVFRNVRAGEGEGLAVRFNYIDLEIRPRFHFWGLLGSVIWFRRVDGVIDVERHDDSAKIVEFLEN